MGGGMNISFFCYLVFPNPTATNTERKVQHMTSLLVAAPTQMNVIGKLQIMAE
jgi:hypothetical protein